MAAKTVTNVEAFNEAPEDYQVAVRKIVRTARVEPGDEVLEVGPGLGSLPLGLLDAGARVTAVEIDRHVVPVLRAQVEPLGVRVVEADALTLDWSELLDPARVDGVDD